MDHFGPFRLLLGPRALGPLVGHLDSCGSLWNILGVFGSGWALGPSDPWICSALLGAVGPSERRILGCTFGPLCTLLKYFGPFWLLLGPRTISLVFRVRYSPAFLTRHHLYFLVHSHAEFALAPAPDRSRQNRGSEVVRAALLEAATERPAAPATLLFG